MNILDENVPENQRAILRKQRVAVRQIGQDLGRDGMKDDEIFPLLHKLNRPTFFTLDSDFFNPRLCHESYCLVQLDVDEESVAEYVRRLLRHRQLNTKAKRLGRVIRAHPTGLALWRINHHQISHLSW